MRTSFRSSLIVLCAAGAVLMPAFAKAQEIIRFERFEPGVETRVRRIEIERERIYDRWRESEREQERQREREWHIHPHAHWSVADSLTHAMMTRGYRSPHVDEGAFAASYLVLAPLNVRDGGGTRFRVVERLATGAVVGVGSADENGWAPVFRNGSRIGYVFARSTRLERCPSPTSAAYYAHFMVREPGRRPYLRPSCAPPR